MLLASAYIRSLAIKHDDEYVKLVPLQGSPGDAPFKKSDGNFRCLSYKESQNQGRYC